MLRNNILMLYYILLYYNIRCMYKMQQNFVTESKKESNHVLCISDSYVIKLCKFKYK